MTAIRHHELALRGDGRFAGNVNYILAYNNLGFIYRKLGNQDKAKEILSEGIERHQVMIDRADPDAPKRENSYVYTAFAAVYFSEQKTKEGFEVLSRGTRIFPLQAFKNDGLDAYMLKQLALSARRPGISPAEESASVDASPDLAF